MKQLGVLKTTEQKMDVISSISEAIKDIDISVPQRYLKYVSSIITPVMKCYHDHCGSSIEKFKEKWGDNFKHTQFSELRCPGPDWRRAGQSQPDKDHNPANYWQIYVMRNYGQVWPAEDTFDINRDLSMTNTMTICGAEFENANWEFECNPVPFLKDLEGKSVKDQLSVIRSRYERYQHLKDKGLSSGSKDRLKTMRHILTCLDHHCGGDEVQFETRFPGFCAWNFRNWCHGLKHRPCTNAPHSHE
jgi:hypothetical protein